VHASTHAEEGALKSMAMRAKSLINDPKAGAHAQALLRDLELKEHAEAMIQKNGIHNSAQAIKNAESSTYCMETSNYNLDIITGTPAPEMPWGLRPAQKENIQRSAHYEYAQLEKRTTAISQLRERYNKDVRTLASNKAEFTKRAAELSAAEDELRHIAPVLQKMKADGIAELNVIHEYSAYDKTLLRTTYEANNATQADIAAREHKKPSKVQTAKQNTSSSGSSSGGPKKDENEKKERPNLPKYANMQEVFKKEEFGKLLEKCVEKIEGVKYQGQQAYRAIKDMVEFGIKEGDKLYLDGLHKDHIEIFKGGIKGAPRNILSVDGRELPEKLAKAIFDGRRCPF
jgi:hypothetical protein